MFFKVSKIITLISIVIFLFSCGGGGGSSLPDVPAPAKPDESKINTISGDGKVVISWEAKPNLTYNVYRSIDNGINIEAQVAANQSTSTFIDTSSSNDIEYTYLISAVGSGKESTKALSPSVTPYARVLKMSAGEHTCIIKNDGELAGRGSLWCWGDNTFGELGIGTTSYSEEPQQVLLDEANADKIKDDWSYVSAGSVHTCAIKGLGNLFCWGYNNNNQLGFDSSIIQSLKPIQVGVAQNLPQGWTKVEVGDFHSCGLREKGTDSNALYCWGDNLHGQIGNSLSGSNQKQITPFQIPGSPNWVDIALGDFHTCGTKKDPATGSYTAWCWGTRFNGQIGDGSVTGNVVTPAEVPLPNPTEQNLIGWTRIATGRKNTCAIRTVTSTNSLKNSIWCWGSNKYGQLGINDKTVTQLSIPQQEASLAIDWIDVKSYSDTVCAQKKTKDIYCWGSNDTGQVGNGTASDTPVLENVTAIFSEGIVYKNWLLFDVGDNHACGLKPNNKMYCWGSRSKTTLGKSTADSNEPVRVNTEIDWKTLSSNSLSEYVVAMKNNGALLSWGRNFDGQLGTIDGQKNNEKSPKIIATVNGIGATVPNIWKKISTGSKDVLSRDFSTAAVACAISAFDDTLWCWGNNSSGLTPSSAPLQVNNSDKWLDISVGSYHICGIKSDDSLWCIGANSFGELGNSSAVRSNSFVAVTIPTAVTAGWINVSAGNYYTCAISKAVQSLYCWGNNTSGKLGNGSSKDKSVPTEVIADTSAGAVNTWKKVAVGTSHSCGIKTNNELNCWGSNGKGELGRGKVALSTPNPVDLPGSSWVDVSVGRLYTCAIKSIVNDSEGELYCWGRNEDGQLGIGLYSSKPSPVKTPTKVGADANWKIVVTGRKHACGIKYDDELAGDSLWCWGLNKYGSLGTGNAWASTPVYLSIP
jgi:alpha-tubulin suppressor-like RCC1 family protein